MARDRAPVAAAEKSAFPTTLHDAVEPGFVQIDVPISEGVGQLVNRRKDTRSITRAGSLRKRVIALAIPPIRTILYHVGRRYQG
jgi:hypothetical protein